MLHNSFYFLLNMSIISAVLILILLGIRFVFSKYIPKKAVHYLWGIVIFRLLFPAALPSRFSLLNLIGDKTKSVMFPRPSAVMPNMSTMNTIKGARQYFPMEYKTDALESFLRISGVAWACISILFILICVTMYLSTSRHLRRSSHLIESGLLYQCMARLKLKKKNKALRI